MQTCSTYFSFFGFDNFALSADESCAAAKLFIVEFGFCFWEINQIKCDDIWGGTRPTSLLPPNMCQSVWVYVWFDQIKRQPVCLTHPHRARDIGIAIWRQAFEMHLVFACLALRVRVWVLQPHFIRNIHREEHLRVVRPNPYTHSPSYVLRILINR